MRRVAVAVALALLAGVVMATSAQAVQQFTCDDNHGSPVASGATIQGVLNVPEGVICTLDDVTVTKSIKLAPGAILVMGNGSRVNKDLLANAAEGIYMTDSVIKGNAVISHQGDTISWDVSSHICGKIDGDLTITDTNSQVYWNIGEADPVGPCPNGTLTRVGGRIRYDNNDGGADISDTRTGRLVCNGNSSPFGDPVYGYNNRTRSHDGPNGNGLIGDCSELSDPPPT